MAWIGILILVGTGWADSISHQRFSMTLRGQSMAQAFQKLSDASGFEIVYSDAIKSQPVNIHLENATIEKALQKILSHSNHTIIYDLNKTIQINVYDAGAPDQGRSSTSVARNTPRLQPSPSRSQASPSRTQKSPFKPRPTPRSPKQKRAISPQETLPPRTLTPEAYQALSPEEQYLADERAAGNIP